MADGEVPGAAGAAGELSAPIYSMELLGEASMATVRAGGALAAVKAAKDFRAEIGSRISASVPPEACHLFDAESGERLALNGAGGGAAGQGG